MALIKPETAQLAYTVNQTPAHYGIQAAVKIGLGRTTLYQLIQTGDLTPIKLWQRTLLPHADLVALLDRM